MQKYRICFRSLLCLLQKGTGIVMKKRLISLVLVVLSILLTILPASAAASLSNFNRQRSYRNEFSDVSPDAWYYPGISGVYEYGVMDGKDGGVFDPAGRLTIAETIKIAAILHNSYSGGTQNFIQGSPWYATYVDYAVSNGIPVDTYSNYNAAATRSDFAVMLAGAFPDEAVTPVNRVDDGAIPDVFESYSYGQAVYKLYRAGVLTGADSEGSFYPGRSLTRAEAATIIMRMIDANSRVLFSLSAELSAEEIYKLASPGVFYIEIFDREGELLKTGSGFFISEAGLAVTNYHVVIGGHSAKITLDDGTVLEVAGIYDYDWKKDIALIQIEGDGFRCLEMADSSFVQTGATVYTLGSPLGLQASYTRGIVSQALREIEGAEYIQLDAPISSGSSGGALLDIHGRVIGVTSATAVGAQNINLAVPINFLAELSRTRCVPLESILIPTEYYKNYYPAPNFGTFFDVIPFALDITRSGSTYSYLVSDLPGDVDEIIDEYTHLLEQNLFDLYGYTTSRGNTYSMYYHPYSDVFLVMGIEQVRGRECFTIEIS